MSYTPKIWADGDIIYHQDLNHIEQGIKDVDQRANPFKGWWNNLATLKAAHTATPGDFAYVKDVAPATTASIYVYDATAISDEYWVDSGQDVDTSVIDSFLSGQVLNTVRIINDLLTGGANNVLSAEQGRALSLQNGYFTCGTGASTAAKTISATGFSIPSHGGSIKVKFTYANTASSPTLNINGTGDKAIVYNGAVASSTNSWSDGEVVEFFFDPTYNSNVGAWVGVTALTRTKTIYNYTQLTKTAEESGYLDNSGVPTGAAYKIYSFDVVAGTTYYLTGHKGGSATCLAAFYDSNGTTLTTVLAAAATEYYQRYAAVAPANAVKVKIMTTNVTSYPIYCENLHITTLNNEDVLDHVGDHTQLETENNDTLVDAINEVNRNLNEVIPELTDVANGLDKAQDALEQITDISPNLFDKSKVVPDKLVSVGGALSSVPSWTYNKATGLIPVLPNKYYQISGCGITQGRNIACIAADGTTRMKVLAPSNGATYAATYQMPNADGSDVATTMNSQFKTPPTAAYVQFTIGAGTVDATDTTMLELVGDTYNPSFVPSAYQPFGKVTVKKSALPEDIVNSSENAANAVRRNFKLKILLVGSSHGMNTIAQVPWICNNSTNKLDVEVGNVYIGSFSLQRLVGMNERGEKTAFKYFSNGAWSSYANKSFAEVFGYTDWDFICIQRSATDDMLWLTTQTQADTEQNLMTNINYGTQLNAVYMSHNDALQYVLNLIRNNATKNAEVIFNSGFADPSEGNGVSAGSSLQTGDIISTSEDMKEQFGVDYIPVAIAIRNARNTFLRFLGNYDAGGSYSSESYKLNRSNNLCYDSQHLDYGIGCYVAGITFLEFICRKIGWDTINLDGFGTQAQVATFTDAATQQNYTLPTAETMMVAKACAKCACDTPDAVSTKLQTRFKWRIKHTLSSGITASKSRGYSTDTDKYVTTFTGTVNSVVVKSSPWDRSQQQTTLVSGTDYTYDSVTQTLTIPSVTGDIEIIVS